MFCSFVNMWILEISFHSNNTYTIFVEFQIILLFYLKMSYFDKQKLNCVKIVFLPLISKMKNLDSVNKMFAKKSAYLQIYLHIRPFVIAIHLFWHTFNCFCLISKTYEREDKVVFLCDAVLRVLALFSPTVMHFPDQLIRELQEKCGLLGCWIQKQKSKEAVINKVPAP